MFQGIDDAFEPERRSAYDGAMTERLTINFNRTIGLFPLPGAVLLPHSVMPLHIFEQRYREMTRDALDGPGLIAMALFDGEVGEDEYLHGQPALKPIVCVGYIERYEPLEDGRYLLLLRGLCRAEIVEEHDSDTSYRTATLRPTEWPPATDEQLTVERHQLTDTLANPVFDRLEAFGELRRLCEQPVPTVGVIDLTIAAATDKTDERYAMLAETDAPTRAAWLFDRLARLKDHMAWTGRTRS